MYMESVFTLPHTRLTFDWMLAFCTHLIETLLAYPAYVIFYVPFPVVCWKYLLNLYFYHSQQGLKFGYHETHHNDVNVRLNHTLSQVEATFSVSSPMFIRWMTFVIAEKFISRFLPFGKSKKKLSP